MHVPPTALFLLQAGILIGLPILIWRLHFIQRLMPLVVMQIIIGITLGPSVFGHIAPHLYESLFPQSSLSLLNGLATLGVCLLGLLTGTKLETSVLKKSKYLPTTMLATLGLPVAMGALVALWFYRAPFTPPGVELWIFIMGFGIAVGVTALPVLSRILQETQLMARPIASRVLAYAAINDLMIWVAVAVLGIGLSSGAGWSGLVWTVGLAATFFIGMFMIVRPLCAHFTSEWSQNAPPTNLQLGIVVTIALACAWMTELIGLHYLLGALTFGAIFPVSAGRLVYERLEGVTAILLLPFFFVLTGLRTEISFNNSDVWLLCAIASIVAVTTKIAGTVFLEYRVKRFKFKEALTAGVLMQTKGLMEVIVLTILLTSGVISEVAFSGLVLMAVVTTLLAKPLLILIEHLWSRPPKLRPLAKPV